MIDRRMKPGNGVECAGISELAFRVRMMMFARHWRSIFGLTLGTNTFLGFGAPRGERTALVEEKTLVGRGRGPRVG